MDYNNLECQASALPPLDSHEDANEVLEQGYSLTTSRGASKRTESGSSLRSSGYPFKRYPITGRPNEGGGDVSNGVPEGTSVDGNRDGVQLLYKSKIFTEQGCKVDKMETVGAKGRSHIYSILFFVIICCFLAEAMLQVSVLMLLKHTDILLGIGTSSSIHLRDVDSAGGSSVEYKLQFVPWKLEERLKGKMSVGERRMLKQNSIRPPRILLVCSNLERTPESLYLITLAKAVQVLGYSLELYTFEDGPMQPVWVKEGISVSLLHLDWPHGPNVDWSNYEAVILTSLNVKHALSSLMQEPFKGVPVFWIILEDTLGQRLRYYKAAGLRQLINAWKQAFERADVVVFPDYTLPMMYSLLDTGNFYVIPGSPVDIWEVEQFKATHSREEVRTSFSLQPQDFGIVVVGSPFIYKGVWREHAMVMRAVLLLLTDLEKSDTGLCGSLRLFFLSGRSTSAYRHALQVMALQLGFAKGTVSHFGTDIESNGLLWAADVVVYSSLGNDEQAFPNILIKAVALERLVITPNTTIFESHLADGVNGLLFLPGDYKSLTHTIIRVIPKQGNLELAQKAGSGGRLHAASFPIGDALAGYAKLLESVVQFPSETQLPLPVSEIPDALKIDWQWQLLQESDEAWPWETSVLNEAISTLSLVNELERQWNKTSGTTKPFQTMQMEDSDWLSNSEWEFEKAIQTRDYVERLEEEELQERREQSRGTWEDIYHSVKKIERNKEELHERDDGELERTGQPLCIYQPYNGEGAWPFLHRNNALYRGVSLSSRQRRPGFDDIDAALRLPLLSDPYYQNAICEYGAFFAIANRIDRVHKNAWIGFQPWQAAGRKVSLSTEAERMLGDAVRLGRDGDTIYFWAGMDVDSRYHPGSKQNRQDFWSFCDAINNDNCRSVFLKAFKQMYGLPSSWTSLPPMPMSGGTWAALHCWVMPTSSFLEFVMFARLFVDALDSQHYVEHHDQGKCCLGISISEVQHCYCRLLELLVNVWAYHSARRMVYVDPNRGSMHEQHRLKLRLGQMWVRFFNHNTLKGLDEDLAEEVDEEHPMRRWLWPRTGEVYSQRMYDRERRQHFILRMERKRKHKERLGRIRSRYRQKPLAGG